MNCTLDICASSKLQKPTADEIQNAVLTLDGQKNDAFLILSQTDTTYMQASGDQRAGFVLEYQESDVGHHYQATRNVTADELVRALVSYSTGSEEWRKLVEWERMAV